MSAIKLSPLIRVKLLTKVTEKVIKIRSGVMGQVTHGQGCHFLGFFLFYEKKPG